MSANFKEHKGLSLTNIAKETLAFWQENNIFQKSIDARDGKEPYVFFEGPPSANGLPGIHHVLGRTIKDVYPRFKTMKGFKVQRKAGWDTHGLPVELGVEKELGITKEDIGTKITIEEYNIACKKAVMKYTDIWNNLTERIGYWVDMEDPYVTYKPKYMETVWWLLGQIYKKDLIYKGYTIQPYSPKAGTGLSSHEINQPGAYQDVTDTTIVAQFKAVKETLPTSLQNLAEVHLLAWTTTPWTLPSNTALTVGPKIEYVLVSSYNQYTFEPIHVILAKNLVGKQFGKKFTAVTTQEEIQAYQQGDKKIPFLVGETFIGKDLEGIKYEQLLPWALPFENAENAFRVITGDFVTTEDGTGIVHTAPTFGADDAFVAKNATPEVPPMLVLDDNENPVPLVDLQGKFTKHVGPHAGKYVKNEYYNDGEAPERSIDVEIAIQLKEENKAFNVEKYKHSYPHCWRTDKPILYYPLDSWFIKVTEVKDRMHELNETINWKPESTGTGRFGNWLKNANDWNLSRSRYWGIPLPIWRTEDGTEEILISSVAELKVEIEKARAAGIENPASFDAFEVGNMSEENYDNIDLHKNVVDAITLVSPKGQPMKREADLIDVWFDSGAMPYAQQHYPFENKELIDNREFYPADFIAEGVDQTRGWFYTLHAISTMVFDNVAYKNVVSNGLVLDKHGKKMSKRLGNGIDPFTTMDQYGPDATRWYMISNANPWDNLKFDLDGIDEVRRKFFGTLYNTYSFFTLYANIDGFKYAEADIKFEDRPEIDRWILSELNTLIEKVDKFYNEYEATKATREIQNFVTENLSNWFVRLSRRRFWKGDYGTDKISAYQTLYTCMLTVAKLGAPVAPFFMDNLYKDLTTATQTENFESVHLAEFPKADKTAIDSDLERKMQKAQQISSMVLSLRKKEMIKVRQPLQKIMIPVLDDQQREDIEAVKSLILSEVNIKEIELLDDASGVLIKNIKPNFKVLGPRFGKNMRFVGAEIQKFTQEDIAKLEREGKISVKIEENLVDLTLDEVEISSQDIEGWLVVNQGGLTVALDVTISDELRNEGVARELVNRVQNLRKDSGLEVTDKIKLSILDNEVLNNAVNTNQEYIKSETLTNELEFVAELNDGLEIEFDDIKSKIFIHKI
ncbi:isoleucine--tRNA ligase [Wenyingzhuangia aestuarii]|uniref:isoleucine--tRNA ligase n=1 Tax=Wenyingzhuangia aestuarii TaxID=1647582 RepID=UPI00143C242D|nr:isoleucine--tRNA ligase [Wenyingzhuangia aestuarii]NJB81485.1 isoleucyl-tRNA synthetase [Wenyingzhuangia aestuarii]